MSQDIEMADGHTTAPPPQYPKQTLPSHPYQNQIVPLNDVPTPNGAAAAADSKVERQRRTFHTQQSTVTMRRQQAICVRRAQKSYGPAKNPNVVLDGLNMTVPKGAM